MIEKILERLERKKELAQDLWDGGSRAKGYAIAIEIVQEAAKDGGWIPTEKELPKDSRDVWVTIRPSIGDCYVTDAFYDANRGKWSVGKFVEVIAWQSKQMPPAPYQKGE